MIIAASTALALGGCEAPPMQMWAVKDGPSMTLYLEEQRGLVLTDWEMPCIHEVAVYRVGERENPLWAIAPENGDCAYLDQFKIGIRPVGFRETANSAGNWPQQFEVVARGDGETSLILDQSNTLLPVAPDLPN